MCIGGDVERSGVGKEGWGPVGLMVVLTRAGEGVPEVCVRLFVGVHWGNGERGGGRRRGGRLWG